MSYGFPFYSCIFRGRDYKKYGPSVLVASPRRSPVAPTVPNSAAPWSVPPGPNHGVPRANGAVPTSVHVFELGYAAPLARGTP